MRRSELLAGFVALSLLFVASEAHAWCRTTTSQSFIPTTDKPCDDKGQPLYWSTRCVGFSVQRDASRWIDLQTAREITQKSFDAWKNVSCPADPVACTGPFDKAGPTIEVRDIGPVGCDCVEYNGKVGNANTIIFRDNEWAECDGTLKPDADTTLALTTVTFNTESGEIYDADMEINTRYNAITVSDPPGRVIYDFQSIVTHEAGHFLGLAHTNLEQPKDKTQTPTMYARYEQHEIYMRDPAPDDVCAICAAYPPSRTAQCDTSPRRGLALECGGGDPESAKKDGCRCSTPGVPLNGGDAVFICAAAALIAGVVQRRARRVDPPR